MKKYIILMELLLVVVVAVQVDRLVVKVVVVDYPLD
jgi:hypothetical protein